MDEVIIERATDRDLIEILQLQKEAYWQEAQLYNDFNMDPLMQDYGSIRTELKHGVILKAVQSEKIIGSVRASVKDNICTIGRLVVKPSMQNQGLGRKLMIAIEAEFPDVSEFQLFTGHRSIKNLYFYEKLGYLEYQVKEVSEKIIHVYLRKRVQNSNQQIA